MSGRPIDTDDCIDMSAHVNGTLAPIIDALVEKCSTEIKTTDYRIYLDKAQYDLIEHNHFTSISTFHPNPYTYFALYQQDTYYYLVESGFPELRPEDEKHFGYKGKDNDSNAALYLLFLVNLNVSPKYGVHETELLDNVFTEDAMSYGIDRNSIESFFPSVNIYEIPVATTLIPGNEADYFLKQIVLKYICATYKLVESSLIKFSDRALELFDRLSVFPDHSLPIDNLIQSILAYRWQFVFLDLYRCIERLYVIGWVHEYANAFVSPMSKVDIHNLLINKHIEHHEEDIIKYLFCLLDPIIISELDSVNVGNASSFIYDLRNRIVHYQQEDMTQTGSAWDTIIVFLLKAIDRLYQTLRIEIQDIGNKGFKKEKEATSV